MDAFKRFVFFIVAMALACVDMQAAESEEYKCSCPQGCECCNMVRMANEMWPELIEGWAAYDGLEYRVDYLFEECAVGDYQIDVLRKGLRRVFGDLVIPKWIEIDAHKYEVVGINGLNLCTMESLELPEGIRQIIGLNYAYNLKKLEIPSGVTRIRGISDCSIEEISLPDNPVKMSYSFNDLDQLKKVTVGCREPYDISDFCFLPRWYLENATLVVPAGSLEAYCSAPVWNNFGTIMDTDGNIGKQEDQDPYFVPDKRDADVPGINETAYVHECPYTCECCCQHGMIVWPELAPGWMWDKNVTATYRVSQLMQECILAEYAEEVDHVEGFIPYEDVVIPQSISYKGLEYDVTGINAFHSKLESIEIPVGMKNLFGLSRCYPIKKISFPDGMRLITGVSMCEELEEIELPANEVRLGNLEYRVFSNLPALKKVTVRCPEPYPLSEGCFMDVDLEACTLVVPVGSLEAYCAAEKWRDFGRIVDTEGRVGEKIAGVESVGLSVGDGCIRFNGDSAGVRVMTLDGRNVSFCDGASSLELPKGIYVIRWPGGAVCKVGIK